MSDPRQPATPPAAAWHNDADRPAEEALDEAVEESMAASDPIAVHTEDPDEVDRRRQSLEREGEGKGESQGQGQGQGEDKEKGESGAP